MKPVGRGCWKGMLAVLALAVAGGCEQKGEFQLVWRFADAPMGSAFTARECGMHAVESFNVTAVNEGGDDSSFRALCGRGSVVREIGVGRWTASLEGVDAANRGPQPDEDPAILRGSSAPFDVVEGGDPVVVPVVVTPRASCQDGVDNDGDGAVDGDDPDCQGEAKTEPNKP